MKNRDKILIVDDVAGNAKAVGQILHRRYDILLALNGEEAIRLAHHETIDLVLLDIIMPGMDGYEVCRQLKVSENLRDIPILFTTADTSPAAMIKGIEAGAYYYLTKPLDPKLLLAVIHSALERGKKYRALRRRTTVHQDSLAFLDRGEFSIRTIDESLTLAATLSKSCPNPEAASHGLRELLLNGIEHGNLGISYREKSTLMESDQWLDEVSRRLDLPENRTKRVRVTMKRSWNKICFHIVDEGDGFDWQRYEALDHDRIMDNHGRGIILARHNAFDHLEFSGKGNEVIATIDLN
uniref:Putative response regulator receiver protein n=1 Tax=Magnetococcus massalia (strain MO-1) TaxID=451514 RepID=A0A1S7LG11_MAGMO|nr:putative response regulator receiver protein [Candidatus Magnetococcus massalia]